MVNLNELRRKVQEEIAAKKPRGDNDFLSNFIKLEMGKNLVRILPWKDDSKSFYSESAVHRIKGDDGNTKNYHCRKVKNEKCPICDFYFDLWAMHKELGLPRGEKSKYGDMAVSIRPTSRYYMNVVDRRLQENGEDNPVKIISVGKDLFGMITRDILDKDYQDEDDPDNTTILSLSRGNDFEIILSKKGVFNSFDGSKTKPKKTPAGGPAEIARWTEQMHDIHTMIKIGDYDDGRKIVETLRAELQSSGSTKSGHDDDISDDNYERRIKVK